VLRKAHRATKLLLHAVIQQKSLMSHPKWLAVQPLS
jgi:hypothetical protein